MPITHQNLCREKGKIGGPIPTTLGTIIGVPVLSILLLFNYIFCMVFVSLNPSMQGRFDGLYVKSRSTRPSVAAS